MHYWLLELGHSLLCAGGSLYIVRCLGASLTFTSIVTTYMSSNTARCSLGGKIMVSWEALVWGSAAGSPDSGAGCELISCRHLSILVSSESQGCQALSTSSLFHPSLTSYSQKSRIFSVFCRLHFSCCMPGFNENAFTFSPRVWFEFNFLNDAEKISVWINQSFHFQVIENPFRLFSIIKRMYQLAWK